MATQPTADEIRAFLKNQYDAWNRNERAPLMAMFDAIAPNGYTIEYVGGAVQEGHAALDEIWRLYGGNGKTELVSTLVNGTEAATMVRNHFFSETSYRVTLSIETYSFSDGRLHVRYFHEPAQP